MTKVTLELVDSQDQRYVPSSLLMNKNGSENHEVRNSEDKFLLTVLQEEHKRYF